jgi:hypothetical protein
MLTIPHQNAYVSSLEYELGQVDQTTRLLGIYVLSGERTAVAAYSSADRILDDELIRELVLTAVG